MTNPKAGPEELSPTVHWQICSDCNYNCSYCRARKHAAAQRASGRINPAALPSPLLLLEEFSKQLPGTWTFNCSGSGEPFQARGFLRVVGGLVKMGHRVATMTNFSAPLSRLREFCAITRGKLAWLRASLHLERAAPGDFLRKAVAVKRLIGDKFLVCSVARKGRLPALKDIGLAFRAKGIPFILLPERDPAKTPNARNPFVSYSAAEQEVVDEFQRGLADKNGLALERDFRGELCLAGCKYLVVDEKGDVWRCFPAATDRTKSGYLGNLAKGTFKLNPGPAVCPYKCCFCMTPAWLRVKPPASARIQGKGQ